MVELERDLDFSIELQVEGDCIEEFSRDDDKEVMWVSRALSVLQVEVGVVVFVATVAVLLLALLHLEVAFTGNWSTDPFIIDFDRPSPESLFSSQRGDEVVGLKIWLLLRQDLSQGCVYNSSMVGLLSGLRESILLIRSWQARNKEHHINAFHLTNCTFI